MKTSAGLQLRQSKGNLRTMNTTQTLTCPDCGREMSVENYVGGYRTFTCRTAGCELKNTTLGSEQWATADLEEYRKINRQNAARTPVASNGNVRYAVLEVERRGIVSKQIVEFMYVQEIEAEIKQLQRDGYSARELGTYFTEACAKAAAKC
jgi:hypothetical protein